MMKRDTHKELSNVFLASDDSDKDTIHYLDMRVTHVNHAKLTTNIGGVSG